MEEVIKSPLCVQLLGSFHLKYQDESINSVSGARMQSLMAFLVLNQGIPQSRHYLAFLFWSESNEKQALTNLRKSLLLLRRHLPNANAYLQVERQHVLWQSDAPCTVDALAFQAELATTGHAESSAALRQRLERAATLYTGELLPGCYDDWIIPIREQLHQQYIEALTQLVDLLEEMREYAAAVRYAQQLLNQDPLHEAGYLRLIRLHALQGDRARSLRVYHTCATRLMREMGVEPNAEIQAAYKQLLHLDEIESADQPRSSDASPVGVATRLIGRQSEWHTLRACWNGLKQRPVHVAVLTGEAGIGKTRLAEELLNWTERQGFLTAKAQAYAAEGGLVYAPVSDWLRTPRLNNNLQHLGDAWLSELTRLLPELLDQHPDLSLPQPFTEPWQQQRLFTALAQGLLAGNQPLLLLLDDLQWCDSETLTWLHYFLRFAEQEGLHRHPNTRLLLLCTIRDNETDADHPLYALLHQLRRSRQLTELALSPLTAAGTETLAVEIAGGALSPEQTAQLFADTGGNPLFVVESMHAASETSRPPSAVRTGQAVSMLPANVYALIQARLAQLSANAQVIVGLAAVIGRAFRYELLAAAGTHSEDEVVQGLEELWKRRIIQEVGSDSYDFSHDRLRDVAYAELSRPRRHLLHRRIAEALQEIRPHNADDLAGQLASHYEQAKLLDKAVTHYLDAGELALTNWAAAQAANYFTRAHKLAPDVDQRAHALYGLARARFLLSRKDEALNDVAQALRLLNDPDHVLRPKLLYLQADLLMAADDPEAAEAPARAALDVAERLNDQATVCQGLSLLGQIHTHRGELDTELVLIERALSIARDNGNQWRSARTQADLAFLHAQQGEFAKAIPLAETALAHLKATTDRGGVAFAWNLLGRAFGGMARFDDAFGAFEQCRQVAEEIDLKSISLQIPNMLGWLHHQLGDYERALALDEEGVALARRADAMKPEISARLNVCHDRLVLGDLDWTFYEMQRIKQQMAHGRYGYHGWRWKIRLLHIQGLWHLHHQEPSKVLATAQEGTALAAHTSARKYIALFHELTGSALAQQACWQSAAEALEQAKQIADAFEYRLLGARTRFLLAFVQRYLGEEISASKSMTDANTITQAIADSIGNAVLQATFLASIHNSSTDRPLTLRK